MFCGEIFYFNCDQIFFSYRMIVELCSRHLLHLSLTLRFNFELIFENKYFAKNFCLSLYCAQKSQFSNIFEWKKMTQLLT